MEYKARYEKGKSKILSDSSICKENRELFKRFFQYEEYKLKRMNNLASLDEKCYKTLADYCGRLRVVNKWFKNKAWKDLTKSDIKRVYDLLEDGKLIKANGEPYCKDTYYNKIIRSKPFEMAGKTALVNEVMEFYTYTRDDKEPRHIIENGSVETAFRKLVDVVVSVKHRALLWLAFDIGENVGSLLQLEKRDFMKQRDETTKEDEYIIILRKEILKRSRTPRSEPTHYKETTNYLDIILPELKDRDKLFDFGLRQAEKILEQAVKKTKIKTNYGDEPKFKDLRSSMACNLIQKGFTADEINARLGHRVGSRVITKYATYFASDRKKPKKKIYDSNLQKLELELEEIKGREKLTNLRAEDIKQEMEEAKVREKGREQEYNTKIADIEAELIKLKNDLAQAKKQARG